MCCKSFRNRAPRNSQNAWNSKLSWTSQNFSLEMVGATVALELPPTRASDQDDSSLHKIPQIACMYAQIHTSQTHACKLQTSLGLFRAGVCDWGLGAKKKN